MNFYRYLVPQQFDFATSAVVLDVGCGTGEQLVEASGRLKIGVEPDFAFAMQAHDRGISVIRAQAEHLPFAANTFNGIICKVVISLTLEDRAIREIGRVIKPAGKAYLACEGSGYYLRCLLLGSSKSRFYGLRTLINTWCWTMTHRRLPGFAGDTIYQSRRRLRRYFKSNQLQIVSQRQKYFLGFPVFIYTEVVSGKEDLTT
jgi:ubiquinone/menaquinone biosynthesis C-methylase UbiE